ncbi:hypothetical protein V6N11_044084 [Hibiscus sabdariffa]|uniref:DUF4005 domain-containing protein n=1 Tax=Hibiscus sabdariffa TaxID=183260 RepID=A0ABR2RE50_9ROSI
MESSSKKHDVVMRRERALAYAYSSHVGSMGLKLAGALDFIAIVPRTSSWPSNHHCNHYCFENMSEKTVAMNVVAIMDSSSYLTQRQSQSGSSNVPSYMSPTQSVKAKVGSQGPVEGQQCTKPQGAPIQRVTVLSYRLDVLVAVALILEKVGG